MNEAERLVNTWFLLCFIVINGEAMKDEIVDEGRKNASQHTLTTYFIGYLYRCDALKLLLPILDIRYVDNGSIATG